MAAYLVPPLYAAFVWWFSTGAVLLLVGLSARFDALRLFAASVLTAAALYGLATSANNLSVTSAYTRSLRRSCCGARRRSDFSPAG